MICSLDTTNHCDVNLDKLITLNAEINVSVG